MPSASHRNEYADASEAVNAKRERYGSNLLHKPARFIILGTGRTGSNYLRGFLNSHSEIITFGELFRDADKIGWDIESYVELFEASNLCSLREQDPAGFLEHVFNMFAPRVRAVGFKIFYFHAESNKALWQYLQRQTEMKVIHLRRRNGLRRLLSLKKAFVTNRWFDSRGIEEKPLSVHLDYDECLNEFQLAAETSEKFDSYFCAHPCHELVYESLVSDYQKEMISVTKFLEVRFEHLRSDTYKQSNQPLEKAILNYFELKDAFRNSPWQVFFDDH